MKAGKDLNQLAAELYRQTQAKRDFVADSRALEMALENTGPLNDAIRETEHNYLLRGIGEPAPINRSAHEQLSSTLGIPKTYYDRMAVDSPDLLISNVNHWLHAQSQKRMIRTLDGRVRAILSDRYRPLDNYDLARAVLPVLHKFECDVVSGEITDHRFYLKATTERINGEVRIGDVVQAGVSVSSSEIGDGALRVEQMSYRLACLNGAIHATAIRKTHVGRSQQSNVEEFREYFRDTTRQADDVAFWLKVQDAVAAMFSQDRFDQLIGKYRAAEERKIEGDPIKVVEVTAKRFDLADTEGREVLKHLLSGNDLSAYGLSNAITRASQDVDSYDRAYELERCGAQVIELAQRDWNELAS